MIKFSIIVPIYNSVKLNEENLLIECIQSLISQTYTDIEIILVDDGSTDEAPTICDAYAQKDGRIVVIHTPNGGAGVARNVGLRKARGEYVLFVDSDDTIRENTCEVFSLLIDKFPDLDIISSDYQVIENGKRYNIRYKTSDHNLPISGREFLTYQIVAYSMHTTTGHHIIRREFMLENELYFLNNVKGGEDSELTLRMYLLAKKVIHSNFIHYTLRKGHISRSNPLNPIQRAKDIIDFCHDLEKKFELIEEQYLKALMMNCLVEQQLYAFMKGRLYLKENRQFIDKQFLSKWAFLPRTKTKVFMMNINPILLYLFNKIRYLLKGRLY